MTLLPRLQQAKAEIGTSKRYERLQNYRDAVQRRYDKVHKLQEQMWDKWARIHESALRARDRGRDEIA